jgi:hypothetical protein
MNAKTPTRLLIVFFGLCMTGPLVIGAEPEMLPQIATPAVTNRAAASMATTNRAWAQSIGIQRRSFVLEGPLVLPLRAASKQTGIKSWAAGTKGFLNLFNPLAPVAPGQPVVVSTGQAFDPFCGGKPRPYAFSDDRFHEPLPLLSLSR